MTDKPAELLKLREDIRRDGWEAIKAESALTSTWTWSASWVDLYNDLYARLETAFSEFRLVRAAGPLFVPRPPPAIKPTTKPEPVAATS